MNYDRAPVPAKEASQTTEAPKGLRNTQPRGNAFAQEKLAKGTSAASSDASCRDALMLAKRLTAVRRELSAASALLARGDYEHFEQTLEVCLQAGVTIGLALVTLMTGGWPLVGEILLGAGATVVSAAADAGLGPDATGLHIAGDGPGTAGTVAEGVGRGLKDSGVEAWQTGAKTMKGVGEGLGVYDVGQSTVDAVGEGQTVDARHSAGLDRVKHRLVELGFPGITAKTSSGELQQRINAALVLEFPQKEIEFKAQVTDKCSPEVDGRFQANEAEADHLSLQQDMQTLDVFGIGRIGKP